MNKKDNFYDNPKKLVAFGVILIVLGFVMTFFEISDYTDGLAVGMGLAYMTMGLHKLYIK